VVFDMVVRYLRHRDFQVVYVRNITDIDDKIIERAAKNHEDIGSLTARFIDAMREDANSLGVIPPDYEPRATDSISIILEMIEKLLNSGYAYQTANGDIYYDVSRFANYGQLSGKHLNTLRAGARVEINKDKDDPLDFVLWKATKPGEPSWNSRWGDGRPGWHIECSAMSTATLGNHFDIHGGGADLLFPHHENEIAQSEAATGEHFVNFWMHNGFVRVNNEKMAKSLGNFFTVRDVLKYYAPEVLRFFIIAAHYRSPLNYSDQNLDGARSALVRLYTALRGLPRLNETNEINESTFTQRFHANMEDDFNTPEALAVCFDLAREINRLRGENIEQAIRLAEELRRLGGILGLLQDNPEHFLQHENITEDTNTLDENAIDQAINTRRAALKIKDYATADRIRADLKNYGIILEDRPGEITTWRRKT